jgi:hypothetical protein
MICPKGTNHAGASVVSFVVNSETLSQAYSCQNKTPAGGNT